MQPRLDKLLEFGDLHVVLLDVGLLRYPRHFNAGFQSCTSKVPAMVLHILSCDIQLNSFQYVYSYGKVNAVFWKDDG